MNPKENADGSSINPVVRADLHDGWSMELGLPNNCSRIVRPDGATAVYAYRQLTHDEAYLIKWGYEEGHKHGDYERSATIKRVLGLP